jgi:hypothetical protein
MILYPTARQKDPQHLAIIIIIITTIITIIINIIIIIIIGPTARQEDPQHDPPPHRSMTAYRIYMK